MSSDGHIRKHSLLIAGHQTSVTLENIFWEGFRQIAAARGLTINALATEIDGTRADAAGQASNLSSAIRVFVLQTLSPETL
ncbi:MAG: ribbon-helix-helix domain-containing protein [Alphaproteobacteria bacterium]